MQPVIANNSRRKNGKPLLLLLGGFIILSVLLAGCGGAGGSTASSPSAPIMGPHQPASGSAQGSSSSSSPSSGNGKSSSFSIPQYLIKTLEVNMAVKDTRQVADELQLWISTTDPHSTSAGVDYEQVSDNLYNVSMSFSVSADMYPTVEHYLADYAQQHEGKLLTLHETVQDVTNDYVDTQSRLTNLRGEQQRLLALLSNTTALNDILNVEQQLTDVEGQIEDIEAHLNVLKNSVTYYTVSINLQPITGTPMPTPSNTPWNPAAILQSSLAAAGAVGEALVTLLIWLLVFSVYIVPVALIVWFIWRRTHPKQVAESPAPVAPPQVGS